MKRHAHIYPPHTYHRPANLSPSPILRLVYSCPIKNQGHRRSSPVLLLGILYCFIIIKTPRYGVAIVIVLQALTLEGREVTTTKEGRSRKHIYTLHFPWLIERSEPPKFFLKVIAHLFPRNNTFLHCNKKKRQSCQMPVPSPSPSVEEMQNITWLGVLPGTLVRS